MNLDPWSCARDYASSFCDVTMPSRRKRTNRASEGNAYEDENDVDVLSSLRDEVADLSQALNRKLSTLEFAVNEIKEGQAGILKSVAYLSEKFEEMKVTTQKLERENDDLDKKNKALQKQVDALSQNVLDLDQYHRRVNLEISGVPERKDEEPEKIALQVAQVISSTVKADDIDIAHRIGKQKEGNRRPRPIIIRFNNRRARNAVYDERRKLKDFTIKDLGFQGRDRIYINENLISTTRELLGEVNKARRDAGYEFLWTYHGRIYVKKNETAFPLIIHGKEDMRKIE